MLKNDDKWVDTKNLTTEFKMSSSSASSGFFELNKWAKGIIE
jgi:hypothetical protein